MGAWGPAIFSDDTAEDVRGAYRDLLEDQVPDEEATRRVIERHSDLDDDEAHVLWLALAAAQHQVGRLDDDVKRRALEIIDGEQGLELWVEEGPQELKRRKAALATLRRQLTGPQPGRKTIRRPYRHVTDLTPGTVLSYVGGSGDMALLRVLRVDDSREGAAPVLERLDWRGRSLPSEQGLSRLSPGVASLPMGPRHEETYTVSLFNKSDPDWAEAGFLVVAVMSPRPADATATAWSYLNWRALRGILAEQLGDPT